MNKQTLIRKLENKCIVLIGMMGCGKSTIGNKLGKQLRLKSYDSDKEIENRLGLSIVDIYEFKGKDYFQEKEAEIVKEIISYGKVVLSTGSDTYLNDELRELIKDKAITIWLKASTDTLYKRIIRRNTRPEIDKIEDKKAALEKMINEREEVYSTADVIVESQDMEPHYVIDTILARLYKILVQ